MERRIPLDKTSRLIKFIATMLGKTWRYSVDRKNVDPVKISKPYIILFWHENILPAAYHLKIEGGSCITSGSKDGKRLSSILQAWNIATVLGSSGRSGISAIRGAIREIKKGRNLAITPDGPRGPRREVKSGVAQISILANIPIVPFHVVPSGKWRLKSWDRFIIPKPFASIKLTYGPPLFPEGRDTSDESIDRYMRDIQEALDWEG